MTHRPRIRRENPRELLPHIKPKKGRSPADPVRAFWGELRKLSGGLNPLRRKRRRGGGGLFGTSGGGTKRKYFQRASVKSRFVVLKKGVGAKVLKRHIRYLKREGVSESGKEGKLFGAHGELEKGEVNSIPQDWENDRHYWRIIISPEYGGDVDLEAFAKEYVQGMERDLDTKLKWLGVAHYNTDKPHVHLLMRGKRDNGEDLILPRDYVSHGMRHRAEVILTRKLGVRVESEVEAQLKKEIDQDRIVVIDRVLFREAKLRNWKVNVAVRPGETRKAKKQRQFKVSRLKYLRSLGLASEVRGGEWEISKDAPAILGAMGRRGDIIKTISRHVGNDSGSFIIHERNFQGTIEGRVRARGLSDELTDRKYLLIDGRDGRSYYVGIDARSELEGRAATEESLVKLTSNGKAVQTDIVSRLSLADQVTVRGATWLDGVIAGGRVPDFATASRFQQEIIDRANERIRFVRSLGIPEVGKGEGRDSTFLDSLYELELGDAEKRLGAEYGRSVRITNQRSFIGKIKDIEELPSGPHFVVLGEGRFTLIPASRELWKLKKGDRARFDVGSFGFERNDEVPSKKQVRIFGALIERNRMKRR